MLLPKPGVALGQGVSAMAREAPILRLSAADERQLRQWANAASTPQALALRARIVLRCAAGPGVPRNDHAAEELGCHPDTISKWRRRFHRHRLEGLADLPRSGRPPAFSPGGPTQGPGAGHDASRGPGGAHLPLVAG